MSIETHLQSVRNYLVSHFMLADDEWLNGCVEFLLEDGSHSISEINKLAKEQWLLNDLKDICPGCLPANLSCQKKTVLNGKYVLQINGAIDIGTPAYQQYLKLQKVNTENIEETSKFDEKIPTHRMIKLYLTDGVQEISGIEYKPMRNLTCDVTPGSKILIKGPIECRRGILFLTESNIELLGGEVQEIAITHSLAGLLSSKLGLPMVSESNDDITTQAPTPSIPQTHSQLIPQPLREAQAELTLDHTRPIARVTSIQVAHNDDDDIDLDQIAAIEAQIIIPKRPLDHRNSEPANNINPFENDRIASQANTSEYQNKRRSDESLVKPDKKQKLEPVSLNNPDEYPDDTDVFEDDDYLRELERKLDEKDNEIINKGPVKVVAEPFVYIKQITDLKEHERAGRVFRVKAQILKILSKLIVGKHGWSLRCKIVDGTGCIDVDFTSGVLSKVVRFTPQEMNQLKKEMATKPELKEKAVKALQKAKDTLQVLYCIIEITMLETPKITCLIPFEETHTAMLKNRIENTGL